MLRIDKVITMSLGVLLFWDTVYLHLKWELPGIWYLWTIHNCKGWKQSNTIPTIPNGFQVPAAF